MKKITLDLHPPYSGTLSSLAIDLTKPENGLLAGGSLSTCDASSLVRARSCTALSCRYGCCVIDPVYRHWNAVQLPKFRAEPPCCLGCAARWSRRLLAAVQTAQHAMCTAHTAGTRYINIATSQSPALERREQCWRALVGVLCAPAGGTPGPNVQPLPGAKHGYSSVLPWRITTIHPT